MKKVALVERGKLHEDSIHEFSAEAAELQFPVGSFPQFIHVHNGLTQDGAPLAYNFGNGEMLVLSYINELAAVYVQQFGCVKLTVFND